MLGVAPAQDDLAAGLGAGVSVEVEAEERVLHQALADHVVEGGHNAVHCDVRVAHAEDPVKLGGHEGHTGLREGLGKCLILDVNTSKGDSVSGEKS